MSSVDPWLSHWYVWENIVAPSGVHAYIYHTRIHKRWGERGREGGRENGLINE